MIRSFIKHSILWLSYCFHRNHRSKVIYYHDVGKDYTSMGTDLETIRRHFDIVRKCGYEFVKSISQEEGQIMVCFDDGWAGLYDAKDFFLENHVYPTVFLAVDFIGRQGYLSLPQILELQDAGFIFEGHTWSHTDLTTFDDIGLKHQILDSKIELSRLLNKNVEALCFPKGRFSDRVYRYSIESGYSKLYSSVGGGYYDLLKTKNLICRNLVQSSTDREFRYIINSTSPFFVKRAINMHYQK